MAWTARCRCSSSTGRCTRPQGDLGSSYLFHAPVAGLIKERLPITLTLGLTGLAIALVVSIPLGILAAMREGTAARQGDRPARAVRPGDAEFLAVAGADHLARPATCSWLPISGIDTWDGYIMPAIVLAFSAIPALMRLTRAGMIDALSSDYIRTARAKGLSRANIVLKHALRNAAMPVVAVAAVQLGFMLGGSIVIEAIFALHGVGYLAWEIDQQERLPGGAGGRADPGHHLHRPDARRRPAERGARSAAARA